MKYLVAVLAWFISITAWANIGSVTDAAGSGGEITRGKEKLSGAKGSAIVSNDVYVTKSTGAAITFKDDTKVRITENSRLVIDDFVFDPKKSDAGKLAMKVGMGTVRYASGQIAKNNPQQVAVKTPTATIAVRGTDFSMTVDEAGQSLVILLPSCKEDEKVKEYELEENTCRVGKIEVSNSAGTVVLDRAFEATYVSSLHIMPTPPAIINITEGKIGNNLILIKPNEIKMALKQQNRRAKDIELEELEAEAQRRIAMRIKETNDNLEAARILDMERIARNTGCNPTSSVCVLWERNDAADLQSRGKGIAFRNLENEHYAEVKTQGSSSQTLVTIVHNDSLAFEFIGDPAAGVSNNIYIKQNSGVLRRR